MPREAHDGLLHDNTGLGWAYLNRARLLGAGARYSSHFDTTDGSWPGARG